MGPGRFGISGTIRRRRGNDVGSAACMIVGGRWRARGDKDGGVGVGHIFDEIVELVGENLFEVVVKGGARAGAANTEQILLKVVVVFIEDGKWGSQCEESRGDENCWGLSRVSLYCWSPSRSGVGEVEVC